MPLFGNRPGQMNNPVNAANVNFSPAPNYWSGDQFVIPGVTPGFGPNGPTQGAQPGFNTDRRIGHIQNRIDSGNLPPQIIALLQQRLAALQGGRVPGGQSQMPVRRGFGFNGGGILGLNQ